MLFNYLSFVTICLLNNVELLFNVVYCYFWVSTTCVVRVRRVLQNFFIKSGVFYTVAQLAELLGQSNFYETVDDEDFTLLDKAVKAVGLTVQTLSRKLSVYNLNKMFVSLTMKANHQEHLQH